MFLIYPATNLLVDKNSVKYGLRTNSYPRRGMVRGYLLVMPVEYGDICAAADAQPFLNKVFQFGIDCTRVLTSDACGMRRHLRCSRCTAFFEQSIPVWNRLSYPTYVRIQYWTSVLQQMHSFF